MPTLISDPRSLRHELERRAKAEGFQQLRVTRAQLPPEIGARLAVFIDSGYHGTMDWLAETADRRASPDAMWPQAKSAIMLGLSYAPKIDPMQRLQEKSTGVISVYALNRDYHDIIKGKLKRLAQWFAHVSGAEVKVFVDTAPLMEKPLAAQAGLGWQGKHTNLVSREMGSWFFIGAILTEAELPHDEAEADHCGSCQACLDICPTRAFPKAGQLDARRCISYLTIEHKGHIAPEFRTAMGNRIYGCDDCLAVCPWNKFAAAAQESKLQARDDLLAPELANLLRLDDTGFRKLFAGSAVKRIGHERFIRNCLVAAGNSGDANLIAPVAMRLADPSPLIRAMAVWALKQLASAADVAQAFARHAGAEQDVAVKQEWAA
jgi:epoxyqueuosine reductase